MCMTHLYFFVHSCTALQQIHDLIQETAACAHSIVPVGFISDVPLHNATYSQSGKQQSKPECFHTASNPISTQFMALSICTKVVLVSVCLSGIAYSYSSKFSTSGYNLVSTWANTERVNRGATRQVCPTNASGNFLYQNNKSDLGICPLIYRCCLLSGSVS